MTKWADIWESNKKEGTKIRKKNSPGSSWMSIGKTKTWKLCKIVLFSVGYLRHFFVYVGKISFGIDIFWVIVEHTDIYNLRKQCKNCELILYNYELTKNLYFINSQNTMFSYFFQKLFLKFNFIFNFIFFCCRGVFEALFFYVGKIRFEIDYFSACVGLKNIWV